MDFKCAYIYIMAVVCASALCTDRDSNNETEMNGKSFNRKTRGKEKINDGNRNSGMNQGKWEKGESKQIAIQILALSLSPQPNSL